MLAKTEMTQSYKNVEKLYSEAMDAFRSYSGQGPMEEFGDDDYDY